MFRIQVGGSFLVVKLVCLLWIAVFQISQPYKGKELLVLGAQKNPCRFSGRHPFFSVSNGWVWESTLKPSNFTPHLEDSCRCRCCGTRSCSLKKKKLGSPSQQSRPRVDSYIFGRTPSHFPQLHAGSINTFRILIKTIHHLLVNFDMASIFFLVHFGYDIHHLLVEFGYDP